MKHIVIISLVLVLSGCSFFHPEVKEFSKYDPRAEYWETNYTGIGEDDHPAYVQRRLEYIDKLRNRPYGHSLRGNPWVYNTMSKKYEAWTWDMVEKGKRNGTVVDSKLGLDYTPPGSDVLRYYRDKERKRWRDRENPMWWIKKYGRMPKQCYQRQYDPQKGY